MAFVTHPATDVDAKSPIDETLMERVKSNEDDLDSRVTTLEAAGGGGGGNSLTLPGDPRIAEIIAGCEDNSPRFVRRRWSVFSSIIYGNRETINGYDVDRNDLNVRPLHLVDNDATSVLNANTNGYLGLRLSLADGKKRAFKVKKGENFFGLVYTVFSTGSTSVTVTVDGVAVNNASLGLIDENGTAISAATFNPQEATTRFQVGRWFLGLDPDKEQEIVVENTDGGGGLFIWTAFETGFRTPESEVSIDHSLNLSAGRVLIRNEEEAISEQTLNFSPAIGMGRTDIVKVNTSGTVGIEKGAEGAFLLADANQQIAQSATTLNMNSTFFAPEKGFALIQNPYGEMSVISWTGKTQSAAEAHTLDGVLWESPFGADFTPKNSSGMTGGTGSATGDVFANVIAVAEQTSGDGIENAVHVQAGVNDKIDFKITLDDSSEVTRAATISPGLYSADLMPLGQAVVEALQAAEALADKGNYFCEYNPKSQKWTIGIRGTTQVQDFKLLVNSGANKATTLFTDLGFTDGGSDLTGAKSYVGDTEKIHLSWRVFDRGQLRSPRAPEVKCNLTTESVGTAQEDIRDRVGLEVRGIASTQAMFKIFTDPDAVGVELVFYAPNNSGGSIYYRVDGGLKVTALQQNNPGNSTSVRGDIRSFIVTFPRGSRTVEFSVEDQANWSINGNTAFIGFAGYRKLTSHIPAEKLSTTEGAFKFFNIRPKKYYKEIYSAPDYVVQTNAFEKIDSITFNGSWSPQNLTTGFTGRSTLTSSGGSVDVTFTIDEDGGGIRFAALEAGGHAKHVDLYINDGATPDTSAANLVFSGNPSKTWSNLTSGFDHDKESFGIVGLPAGQYTATLDVVPTGVNFNLQFISIIDGTSSDENAVTNEELQNDHRTISMPLNIEHRNSFRDSLDRVAGRFDRTGFNEGKVLTDVNSGGFTNFDREETDNLTEFHEWFGQFTEFSTVGGGHGTFGFLEETASSISSTTGYANTLEPELDGRNDATFSSRIDVKAGTSVSASRQGEAIKVWKKYDRLLSADMPDSTTINLNDTRGLRVNQKVYLTADGQTTVISRIASIIADTSATLEIPVNDFANFTTANNARVFYGCFHNYRIDIGSGNSGPLHVTSMGVVPLPLKEILLEPLPGVEPEIAVSINRDVSNGDDLVPPVYEDGTIASWNDIIPVLLGKSAASSFNFDQGYQDVTVSSGTIDVKLVAIRRTNRRVA